MKNDNPGFMPKLYLYVFFLISASAVALVFFLGRPLLVVKPGEKAVVVSKMTGTRSRVYQHGYHFIPEGLIPFDVEVFYLEPGTVTWSERRVLYRDLADTEVAYRCVVAVHYDYRFSERERVAAFLSHLPAAERQDDHHDKALFTKTAEALIRDAFHDRLNRGHFITKEDLGETNDRQLFQARLDRYRPELNRRLTPLGLGVRSLVLTSYTPPTDPTGPYGRLEKGGSRREREVRERLARMALEMRLKREEQANRLDYLTKISELIRNNPLLIQYLYIQRLAPDVKFIIENTADPAQRRGSRLAVPSLSLPGTTSGPVLSK